MAGGGAASLAACLLEFTGAAGVLAGCSRPAAVAVAPLPVGVELGGVTEAARVVVEAGAVGWWGPLTSAWGTAGVVVGAGSPEEIGAVGAWAAGITGRAVTVEGGPVALAREDGGAGRGPACAAGCGCGCADGAAEAAAGAT